MVGEVTIVGTTLDLAATIVAGGLGTLIEEAITIFSVGILATVEVATRPLSSHTPS